MVALFVRTGMGGGCSAIRPASSEAGYDGKLQLSFLHLRGKAVATFAALTGTGTNSRVTAPSAVAMRRTRLASFASAGRVCVQVCGVCMSQCHTQSSVYRALLTVHLINF